MAMSLSAVVKLAPVPGGMRSTGAISIKSAMIVSSSAASRFSCSGHAHYGLNLFLPLASVDVSAPTLRGRVEPSVGLMNHEAHVARATVRWQAQVGERFFGGVVGYANLEHLTGLLRSRDCAPQLFGHANMALDHFDRRHAHALRGVPEVILDTRAGVLPQRNADSRDGGAQTEGGLVGEERAMRRATDQLHQVKRICAAHSAAADAEETVHRPHVVSLADQTLDEFEAVDVREREIRLDTVLNHLLDVLEKEVGRRVGHKVSHRMEHRRIRKACPGKFFYRVQCCQVIEGRSAADRDLIRLWIDLGQLVARVVALELRLLTRLRRKRDGPANLQDHLGYGLAQARDLLAIFVEFFGDVAGLGIANMDVQERGTCVVTIDRDLGLLLPGDGEFLFGR